MEEPLITPNEISIFYSQYYMDSLTIRHRFIDEPLRHNYLLYRAVMTNNINDELYYYFTNNKQ